MRKSFEEHRLAAAGRAKVTFANHVLEVEGDRRWLCHQPDTGIYHFRIIGSPGCVIMHGDIGELVLLPNDRNSIAWLRGSVKSLDYVLGKSLWNHREREFFPEEAEAYLDELDAEEMKESGAASLLADRIREHWDGKRDSVEEWLQACHDADDDEPPDCTDWSTNMLCQYHGLRKFCELLDASEKTGETVEEQKEART